MLIGPAMLIAVGMVTALSVVPSALLALPIVKPPSVGPNTQPEVEKSLVKSFDSGSMRKAPAPE